MSIGIVNYDNEVPLGDIKGIVVDNNEHIYIGLGFYGKIQVYNNKGEFIKNWKVAASGGTFNMNLTEDQNILITVARGDKRILYDQNGHILSKNHIDNIYLENRIPWNGYTTNDGETYEVKGGIFPKVVRLTNNNEIIIKQGLILQLMKGPLPAWLIGALGIGINFLLRKEELREQIKKYTKHNKK